MKNTAKNIDYQKKDTQIPSLDKQRSYLALVRPADENESQNVELSSHNSVSTPPHAFFWSIFVACYIALVVAFIVYMEIKY